MNKNIKSNTVGDDDYGIFVVDDIRRANRKDVIVTDLDGTLIKSDILYESIISYLKINFFFIIKILMWALKGKALLKRKLANEVFLDVEKIPYNECVLDYLKKEKEKGRYLVIASASNSVFVNSIADHLGIFDEALSSGKRNLSGKNKADLLVDRFGSAGYEYIGNSNDDVPVWDKAGAATIVSRSYNFSKKISRKIKVPVVNSMINKPPVFTWLKAIRLHQWVKNLIVFFPIIASHRFLEWAVLSKSLLAFFSFSLCASSIYIVNDLIDLQEDRKHPEKRKRAFACGDMDIATGAKLFLLLMTLAIVIATFINIYTFYVVMTAYLLITIIYSAKIKQVIMADVVTLGCLYTMRIVAGAMATDIELSVWLLTFSVFAFCGLALLKRFGEFSRSSSEEERGRGYQVNDASIIAMLGIGASLISILIFVLYINDPFAANLYSNPKFLWILVPVFLYWFGRIWILASRGLMNYDPVLFVTRDYVSLFCGLIGLIAIIMAL